MNSLKAQRGASFLNIVMILIVASFAVTIVVKLTGPYLEHRTINSIFESVINSEEEMKKPVREIKRDISRRFTINQVSLPDRENNLQIVNDKGVLKIDLEYEVRVPMFGNVDAMVKFKNHYEGNKP